MRSKNKYTIDDCISEMCRWGQKLLSPVALSLKISCRGSQSLRFVTLSRVSEALTRCRVVACREAKNCRLHFSADWQETEFCCLKL